jgi:hypothetical protein
MSVSEPTILKLLLGSRMKATPSGSEAGKVSPRNLLQGSIFEYSVVVIEIPQIQVLMLCSFDMWGKKDEK